MGRNGNKMKIQAVRVVETAARWNMGFGTSGKRCVRLRGVEEMTDRWTKKGQAEGG